MNIIHEKFKKLWRGYALAEAKRGYAALAALCSSEARAKPRLRVAAGFAPVEGRVASPLQGPVVAEARAKPRLRHANATLPRRGFALASA